MDAVVGVCGVWDHAGITRFDDLFTKETLFGAARERLVLEDSRERIYRRPV